VVAALHPRSVGAETIRVAPDAEVRSIRWQFSGPHKLSPSDLAGQIATTAPGSFDAIQGAFAWLPLVPPPDPHPFDPVVLQQDVVRLRRHYRRQGFPAANVDYAVKTDRSRRKVSVTLKIDEGTPLLLRSVKLTASDGSPQIGPPDLNEEIQAEWRKAEQRLIGQRFSEQQLASIQSGIDKFFADRGFIRSKIEPRAAIDSIAGRVDLDCIVDTGVRARFGDIQVAGNSRVAPRIVTRELGFSNGDWASRSALDNGRANVLSVQLFRSARLEVGGDSTATTLPVVTTVREDRPRFTALDAGYATDGAGVSGQVRWTHPNFTGDARSLNAIVLFQTGWWATSDTKDRLFRTALVMNQPFLYAPALSLGFGPSIEARDGNIDRSKAWSVQSTLVWRFNTLQSAALRYEYTHRVVDEPRSVGGADSGVLWGILPALGLPALADSLRQPIVTSLFNLTTSVGKLDNIARPQHGLILKPNLSITAPPPWGSVEFGRADLQATAFAPLPGRSNAVMFRGNLGGLWPFGQSIPSPGESPAIELARLRDFSLTAGGASDVRGYGNRLLGPKIPKVNATVTAGDTILSSDQFVETGALRRWTASVELRLGVKQLGPNVYAHLFGDAGRVWTSDPRFALRGIRDDDLIAHFTTGGGLGYYTPVGAIRFDLGYKLNPSTYDVRHASDVLAALEAGRDPATAPVDHWLRYGLHLSLGLYF